MKICPSCEAGYPDELTTCPLHGGLLSEIRELKPGMLIRNTYRIVRKLSKGGMAHVYLAQHVLLNEPQVLKFLSPDLSSDKDWTNRFLREVRTLRQIRHKNVITAGNLEPAEDGTLFFSMEYIEGPDLHEFYHRAPQPFDVALALELVHDIADGLGAAHAAGVVHRDIKPENILVAVEGDELVPKIADFGIVAIGGDSRLTQSGNALLTPQFAAPEQWLGIKMSALDGRTDLYALGGLLFELLTGQCAFKAENYHEWAQQHMHAPAPRPSTLRAELKNWRGLDELVLRLLAKDPDARPANVAEVLRLIDGIVPVPAGRVAMEPSMQEQSALQAAAGDAAESSDAESQQPRVRLTTQPLKVWEPLPQPIAPPRKRRTHLSEWLVAVAVAIVFAIATWRFALNTEHQRTLSSQKDAVFAVAFAPNGIGLASASRDNTVQFWNLKDELALGTIQAATTSLAFSPDGHAVATGMADDSIDIWDAAHDSVLGTMIGHTGTVAAVAFSPDGQKLASASWDKSVRVWEVSSGRLLKTLSGHTDRVLAVAYSRDGRMLASAGADQTVCLWDTSQGTLLRTLRGHTKAINSLAFSPDGHTLASASDDLSIKLWNVETGAETRTLHGHAGPVLSVSFSPDGHTLASGSADADVRLWSVADGQSVRVLKGHNGAVLSVAFSPFSYSVASGGADKTIRVWDVTSARK